MTGTVTVDIVSRWDSAKVLYHGEINANTLPEERVRVALELAVMFGADLAGANLARVNLARANLAGANLAGANLGWARLGWAKLAGANLGGANLSRAVLAGADLTGADLARANLCGANLCSADLTSADLYCTNLTGADLYGAIISMKDGRSMTPHPTNPETAQQKQDGIYTVARGLSAPIEYFGNWIYTVWDFDTDAVDTHDIWAMREITAWMETMPPTMRAAFLAYVKAERTAERLRRPDADQDAITVLGVNLPGRTT